MEYLTDTLTLLTELATNGMSTAFAVIANLLMGGLLYLSVYYWMEVRYKYILMRRDYEQLRQGGKPHELQDSLFNNVIMQIIDRRSATVTAEGLLREQFHPLFLKLNHLKELGPTAGMLFTVLSIILFGLSMKNSSAEAAMSIFTTALSTTALGALVSIITGHVLVRIKVIVIEAAYILETTDMVKLGLKRKSVVETGKAPAAGGML